MYGESYLLWPPVIAPTLGPQQKEIGHVTRFCCSWRSVWCHVCRIRVEPTADIRRGDNFRLVTLNQLVPGIIPDASLTMMVCVYVSNALFCLSRHAFLYRPKAFARTFDCGGRWGSACTLQRKRGPRPDSVARALGAQICARYIRVVDIHGNAFRRGRAKQDDRNPTSSFFSPCDCCTRVTLPLSVPGSLVCRSHTTTALVARQALRFVMATDSVRVCHVSCRPVGSRF